jgi:hypothetical protein
MAGVSKWRNKLNRLKSMSARELGDRVRQQSMARVDALRHWAGQDFVHTIDPSEVPTFGKFYFDGAGVLAICETLAQRFPTQAKSIVFQAENICRHRFDLLGYEGLNYGDPIDWHRDAVHGKIGPRKSWFQIRYLEFEEVGDAKVTWELNRHQHFVTLAKAYRLTGNEVFAREIFAQWEHWRSENPYPIGMNWASSLEVAFRTMSWIWTFFLLRETDVFTIEMQQRWMQALALNGRHIETYLSTYFSPNTHLLGEALALFFLGTLFPQMKGAKRWRQRGWNTLVDGARVQVYQDGFYFEQSTYYHVYALDMFLHGRILAEINGVPIPAEFDQTLQRMSDALALLGRAGSAPRVGDDDGGRLFDPRRNRDEHMLDPLSTSAVVFGRGDHKFLANAPREETLWLLGPQGIDQFDILPSVDPSLNSAALECSGFYLMADAESGQQLAIHAGPCGAGSGGHGHADALSICLMQDGRTLLMDPGTFEYVGDSGERNRLRGTGAHNTMLVDGRDQAEPTGPFAWKNCQPARAERWITGRQFNFFEGFHPGSSRLDSSVAHRRWVFHRKQKFWLVVDRAEGTGRHEVDIAWHLGPGLTPESSKACVFGDAKDRVALLAADDRGWSQSVSRDYWSPVYGRRERANVVSFGATLELPSDFATLLIAETIAKSEARADLGRLSRIQTANKNISAFQYSSDSEEHNFVFAQGNGKWTAGPWSSDADFVYWSGDRQNELYTLVCCNASYVDAGTTRIVSCDGRIKYVEVSSIGNRVDMNSSHPEQVRLQAPIDRIWTDAALAAKGESPRKTGV